MSTFEQGYSAALADVVELAQLYGEENMTICGDNIMMDPLLRGGAATPENMRLSVDCSVRSTIHSAQFHASEHLIKAIEALPRRKS